MAFINVGAYSDNKRIQTKSALKRMVKNNPELVRFDTTSALFPREIFTIEELLIAGKHNPTITLLVVGPDPYSCRKWYANVYVKNGRVIVN